MGRILDCRPDFARAPSTHHEPSGIVDRSGPAGRCRTTRDRDLRGRAAARRIPVVRESGVRRQVVVADAQPLRRHQEGEGQFVVVRSLRQRRPVQLFPDSADHAEQSGQVAVLLPQGQQLLHDHDLGRQHGDPHPEHLVVLGPGQHPLVDRTGVQSMDDIDHGRAPPGLEQPVLRRPLDQEPGAVQTTHRVLHLTVGNHHVDVVVGLPGAVHPQCVPAGHGEGDLPLLEGRTDPAQPLAQSLPTARLIIHGEQVPAISARQPAMPERSSRAAERDAHGHCQRLMPHAQGYPNEDKARFSGAAESTPGRTVPISSTRILPVAAGQTPHRRPTRRIAERKSHARLSSDIPHPGTLRHSGCRGRHPADRPHPPGPPAAGQVCPFGTPGTGLASRCPCAAATARPAFILIVRKSRRQEAAATDRRSLRMICA